MSVTARAPARSAAKWNDVGLAVFWFAYALHMMLFFHWSVDQWNQPLTVDYSEMIYPWVFSSAVLNSLGLIAVKRVGYFSLGLWFVVLSYIFMFGTVVVRQLDLTSTQLWDPSAMYAPESLFHAAVYAIAVLSTITCGCMLGPRLNSSPPWALKQEESSPARFVGIACLFIGVPASLISSSRAVTAVQESGSYASFGLASQSGLYDDLAFLVVPGVIFLLCSGTLSRMASSLLTIGVVGYLLSVMTLTGSRKIAVFSIIGIVACYAYTRRSSRRSWRRSLAFVLLALIFLNTLAVIRANRFELAGMTNAIWASFRDLGYLGSLAGETLSETGLTFYSLAGIVQVVPAMLPFELGMTVIRTLPTALPVGWLIQDFITQAASTAVINPIVGPPVGSSLIGDFYWNWGFAGGLLVGFLFGLALAWIQAKGLSSSVHTALYFSTFWVLLLGVRSGMVEIFRPLILVVLVPFLILSVHGRANVSKGW